MTKSTKSLQVLKERAILVAAYLGPQRGPDCLDELAALARSAGAIVVGQVRQRLRSIHPATYVGRGKAEDLAQRARQSNADIIIFDNDLSPAQIRELEEIIQRRVIDRSELILDIFASRARTKQAKLQVELAQLEYTYPRLTRMWSHLDSVAGPGGAVAAGRVGGIGTRGPGEQQLEIDRRLVSRRITELRQELERIDRRKLREIQGRKDMYKVCLVGYTNAGKSTLLNALTGASVVAEDRPFSTLDTRTRIWTPQKGIRILVSDTVGFIRDLPEQLVQSFKATLEEAITADLLLHVIDVSNANVLSQIEAVEKVLTDIGCGGKPVVKVLNKADTAVNTSTVEMLQTIYPEAVAISAKLRIGLDRLAQVVCQHYAGDRVILELTTTPADGRVLAYLQAHGHVVDQTYEQGLTHIKALLGRNQLPGLMQLRPLQLEVIEPTA
ncbi:MAG: GTPase HflX [Sedimentisphaerales bacterium]|nr:GTPase HflX [Sedimentisphaerales bacterium]